MSDKELNKILDILADEDKVDSFFISISMKGGGERLGIGGSGTKIMTQIITLICNFAEIQGVPPTIVAKYIYTRIDMLATNPEFLKAMNEGLKTKKVYGEKHE